MGGFHGVDIRIEGTNGSQERSRSIEETAAAANTIKTQQRPDARPIRICQKQTYELQSLHTETDNRQKNPRRVLIKTSDINAKDNTNEYPTCHRGISEQPN